MDDLESLTSLKSHSVIFDEINRWEESEGNSSSSSEEEEDKTSEEKKVKITLRTVVKASNRSYVPSRPCELRLERGDDVLILPVPRHMDFCIGKRLKDSKIGVVPLRVFSRTDREKEYDVVDSKIVKAIVNTYIRSGGQHSKHLKRFTQCVLSSNCRHARFLRDLKKPVSPKWYVADTKKYGRGVFASQDLRKGESVAICPYIVDTKDSMDGRFMDFAWDESGFSVMVLGCGSLLNHSDKHYNIEWRYRDAQFSADDPSIQFIVYETTRDVKKDEELKINYGDEYWSCETRKTMRKKKEELAAAAASDKY